MERSDEESGSPATKTVVRHLPKRGQIKAKIMTQFVRMVEDSGRALCSKEKVRDEPHPSKAHHSSQ